MKRIWTDQMNKKVEVNYPPKRIISLVPSQTELLYDLGLADEVVGQTLFCIHPKEMHQSKPRVGGTKNVKLDKIALLKPDLIIGNKEENDQKSIESLMEHYPVWMSDIQNLEDALDMMEQVGELLAKPLEAQKMIHQIRDSFSTLKPLVTPLRTGYFIWRSPWMAAGNTTFITDMLKRLGLVNVFEAEISRYPQLTEDQIKHAELDVILLSSEPYPFKEKHITELQNLCPKAKILLVDGELFSWYGSRLLHSVDYFKQLIKRIR